MKRLFSYLLILVTLLTYSPTAFAATQTDKGYDAIIALLAGELGEPKQYIDETDLFTAMNDTYFNTERCSNFAVFDLERKIILVGGKLTGGKTKVSVWENLSYDDISAGGYVVLSNYKDINSKSSERFAFAIYDAINSLFVDSVAEANSGEKKFAGLFGDEQVAANSWTFLSPTATPKPATNPTKTPKPTTAPASDAGPYIGNKNTKKFHYPWCSSVGQMKASNKVQLNTRQEAINLGYVPCQKCNP